MKKLNSRERMLRAINRRPVDRIPCCFMSFTALRKRVNEDRFALVDSELEMGFDSMLFIPAASRSQRPEHPDLRGLSVSFHPDVKTREWLTNLQNDDPVLHREYLTPGGKLKTSVQLSDDWPHGNHLPFIDDFQIPRSLDPLIQCTEDLGALQYLLTEPSEEDRKSYLSEFAQAKDFSKERGVILAGGWGVGLDMADWLCGIQNLTVSTMENPEFVQKLLEMIHQWNLKRMELVLSAPVDLFIRRAWYEGCDFLTPKFFNQVVLPQLKAEVSLAHEYGAKFGYICSSGTLPMLNYYLEAGIDVLIGIDPIQGTYTNMSLMKERVGERICLWGGVSGAMTVEMGSESEVRQAVKEAVQSLGPTGFILCPVDNITEDTKKTWENLQFFTDEWQKQCQ